MYAYTYALAHERAHKRTYIRTHIHMSVCAYTHTYIHAYTRHAHTGIHTYTHTCMHASAHTQASVRFVYALRFLFRAHTFRQEIITVYPQLPTNILSNAFRVIFFSFFSRWLSMSYELFSLVLLLVLLLFVSFHIISSEHQTRCSTNWQAYDGKQR